MALLIVRVWVSLTLWPTLGTLFLVLTSLVNLNIRGCVPSFIVTSYACVIDIPEMPVLFRREMEEEYTWRSDRWEGGWKQ